MGKCKLKKINQESKNAKRKKVSMVKFITTFTLVLHSIDVLIRKHVHYLHSDKVLKKVFPNNTFSVMYKRKKILKKVVASYLYNKPSTKSNHTIGSCKKCDIRREFCITDINFRPTVTVKTYFLKGNLLCNSCNDPI